MRTTTSLLVLAAVAGCDAQADPKPDDLATTIAAIHQRMHVRELATGEIRNAIAFGELDRAKSQARVITALDEPAVLAEWKPHFASVRIAATRGAEAKDLATAARALADLGGRCGACHEAVPAKIAFAKNPRPVTDGSLATRMAEHKWAIAQMWDGLVGPSKTAWDVGAAALESAPLTIVAEAETKAHPSAIGDDVAQVRLFATRASNAKTQDERVRVFGDLLARCAHCHAAVRDTH